MDRVSVVIPTYNTGDLLRPTIESALALAGVEVEVIVVDDGSSDDTAEIAASYLGVTVVRQANAGDAAARQRGLKSATGNFVIFLDHDDILHTRAAQLHLAELHADDTLDMVFGSNVTIDTGGRQIGENRQQRRRFSAIDVVKHTTPSFSQCMYRKSSVEAIGGLRPEAKSCADIDLNMRLLGWRQGGLCHGGMVMSYRLHAGQQTRSPSKLFSQMIEVLDFLLGPGRLLENPILLAYGHRYWTEYYGQFIPAEIVRAVRRGDHEQARRALRLFVRSSPRSVVGAGRFAAARLFGTGKGARARPPAPVALSQSS